MSSHNICCCGEIKRQHFLVSKCFLCRAIDIQSLNLVVPCCKQHRLWLDCKDMPFSLCYHCTDLRELADYFLRDGTVVFACLFPAVVPDAHNSTYRYAMYKDKRHASDSSTKLYPHATAHKGSGLLLPCNMPGVLPFSINATLQGFRSALSDSCRCELFFSWNVLMRFLFPYENMFWVLIGITSSRVPSTLFVIEKFEKNRFLI